MKINLYGKIPENETFIIKINNEIKVMDEFNSNMIFNLKKKQTYEIEIFQELSKSNHNFLSILFFFVTFLIQGIFNIIFMNTDYMWYKSVSPYCLKAIIKFKYQKALNIKFTYYNSKYNDNKDLWIEPIFKITPSLDSKIIYIKDLMRFKNECFNYIKKIISVSFILILLFSYLLYISISRFSPFHSLIIFVFILATILLVIYTVVKELKRLKKYLCSFE